MANFLGLVYATLKNEGIDTSNMSQDEAVKKFNELKGKNGGTPAEERELSKYLNNKSDFKQKQLDVVLKENPATDDYHTWIRKVDDIKTFEEALQYNIDDGYDEDAPSAYPDVTRDMIDEALKSGYIEVYSSKPIKNGIFVTPSKMQAQDYAGGNKIYSTKVSVKDVAWINLDEGQFAKVD